MPPLLRALLLACGWVALLLPPCPFYAAAAQPAAGRRQESGAPAKTGLHQHSNSYRSGLSRSVCNRRILLKLGERRVYIYEGERVLASYPVAVGKKGWETPTGRFRVIHKVRHPRWKSPWSGRISPPGPRSPLGERWIGFWSNGRQTIGFHGTPGVHLLGQAVSHGCVRMRNRDIKVMYDLVEIGTPVIVEP
ncbi:MAG: L,D-transpeptidase [Deltaproteobacteria bacterium]|nr:L,D-transpeptidase [Deltaproteobacteria bacterium]